MHIVLTSDDTICQEQPVHYWDLEQRGNKYMSTATKHDENS